MRKIDDGGPAFPVLPPIGPDGLGAAGYPYSDPGMSLRDYFAAQALPAAMRIALEFKSPEASPMPSAARTAYEAADALLRARQETAA